jgi:hypothetical protein
MINIYNSPMSIENITLTSNIESKIIDNINLPLLGFIQGCEQGSILSHMMSAPGANYPFILWRMRQQGLRSSNLEGEIMSGSINSGHVSFKVFNIVL